MLLCVARILLIASPGYIHPDEFFQSAEVFVSPPWEFQSANALRTPVFPWVMSHVPRMCFRLWFSPRLLPLAVSFLVDVFVWRSSLIPSVKQARLLLLASSWPMLVLQSRSFSNGLESVCVAAISLFQQNAVVVGAVGAVGVFARFTFPAFAVAMVKLPPAKATVVAAIVVSLVFVGIDSSFYGCGVVVTPLNALLYNVNTTNVATHGLHPRYVHSVVNLPMLLGPVVVSALKPSASWIVPLAILSLSPHQVKV